MNALYFIVVGVLVGILTGLTGSSGVLIVVPAYLYAGFTFKQAVGSSLLIDVVTTISVVYSFFTSHKVDVRKASVMALSSTVGAQTGAILSTRVQDVYLELAFTVFTSVMAYVSFRRAFGKSNLHETRGRDEKRWKYVPLSLFSFLIGNVASTIGASGGIMFLSVLMLLFSMDVKELIGTATLAMFFTALSGSLAFLGLGLLPLGEALTTALTSLVVGYFVSRQTLKLRPSLIYGALGLTFVLTTVSTVLRLLQGA